MNAFSSKYIHIQHRFEANVFGKAVKESNYHCDGQCSSGVNDGSGIQRATLSYFSGPRPRRGRHVLAPRDPSDPATLPTLRAGVLRDLYARFTAAQSGARPERGSGQGPRFARQARPFSLGAAGEHALS